MSALLRTKVVVLILDDNRGRDPVYRRFFKKIAATRGTAPFQVVIEIPPSPAAAISAIYSKRADLIVIDMIFSEARWAAGREQLLVAIERSLANEAQIWTNLLSYARELRVSWEPASSGALTLLHLTDTHLGLTQPDDLDVADMARAARREGLQADCIAWSGDITQGGFPDEYDRAYTFREQLHKQDLVSAAAPVFMVPGNHDLCWPLALADQLERRPDGSGWNYEIVDGPPKRNALWEAGLEPYRSFYSRVTGFTAPLATEGFRFLPYWRHLGVGILEIMSETHQIPISSSDPGRPRVTPTEFKDIAGKALSKINDAKLEPNVCIIVIAHRLYPDTWFLDEWRRLLRLISDSHPLVVLTGHTHEADTGPLGGAGPLSGVRALAVVGVPHSEAVPTGSLVLPRVGYITLENLGTSQLRCKIARLQKRERQSWQPEAVTRFRMEPTNRHWVSTDA